MISNQCRQISAVGSFFIKKAWIVSSPRVFYILTCMSVQFFIEDDCINAWIEGLEKHHADTIPAWFSGLFSPPTNQFLFFRPFAFRFAFNPPFPAYAVYFFSSPWNPSHFNSFLPFASACTCLISTLLLAPLFAYAQRSSLIPDERSIRLANLAQFDRMNQSTDSSIP